MTVKIVVVTLVSGLMAACAGNGIFDTQPQDCSIVCGEAELEGRFTETEADGHFCVRRGECTQEDRAHFDRVLGKPE